ncbi:hypothetical protein SLEP1_g35025 [Rubroshorea leprosula]|uniref:Uncharacterized protein n=1 Tax=Rubroshorea leprosula TaxID=152421 RepID=A0AAV5KM83_9ROSI|nr:hypothetical protein SLEP1_g35025 [Rubroshorea leprosula]
MVAYGEKCDQNAIIMEEKSEAQGQQAKRHHGLFFRVIPGVSALLWYRPRRSPSQHFSPSS